MAGGFKNRQDSPTELTAAELLWVQTGEAGVLLLQEQAIAPSPTANYGKVYVKDSDHNLYYLDEAGNEYQLTPSGSVSLTTEVPTGTVNDSNVDFVFTEKPFLIVVNGGTYREGAGTYGWSWNGGTNTATFPFPIGSGGDIYGIMT